VREGIERILYYAVVIGLWLWFMVIVEKYIIH